MVVRFDHTALKRQTSESTAVPIGVEGDVASRGGALSEAEAIVKGAKESLVGAGGSVATPAEADRIAADVIREEAEAEAGAGLGVEGARVAKTGQ